MVNAAFLKKIQADLEAAHTKVPQERRQYIKSPADAPKWAQVITTKRGKHYYKPKTKYVNRETIIANALKQLVSNDQLFDSMRKKAESHADNTISTYVADLLGFHAPPKIISEEEFSKLDHDINTITMRRGVGGRSTEDFITGKNKIQRIGAYGAGCYTAECNIIQSVTPESFGIRENKDIADLLLESRESDITSLERVKKDMKCNTVIMSVFNGMKEFVNTIPKNAELDTYWYDKMSKEYTKLERTHLDHLSVSEYRQAVNDIQIIDWFNDSIAKFHQENCVRYIDGDYNNSEFDGNHSTWREKFLSYLDARGSAIWMANFEANTKHEELMKDIENYNTSLNNLSKREGGQIIELGITKKDDLPVPKMKSKNFDGSLSVAKSYGLHIYKMALDPSAKVGDYYDVKHAEIDYEKLGIPGGKGNNYLADIIEDDIGTKAIIMGYDAIRIHQGVTTADEADYILLFNRGKVLMVKPPMVG